MLIHYINSHTVYHRQYRTDYNRNSKFLEDLESVDEDSEALKQRHTANFEIESYNITSNSFGVWVKNITGDADDIELSLIHI